MLAERSDPAALAEQIAEYFSSDEHGSHGRRISRDDAKVHQLEIVDLEDNQDLQEQVLTLYHLSTIAFDNGPAVKSVVSSNGRVWIKNMQAVAVGQKPSQAQKPKI